MRHARFIALHPKSDAKKVRTNGPEKLARLLTCTQRNSTIEHILDGIERAAT